MEEVGKQENLATDELPKRKTNLGKEVFENVAPLSVDIGGSFTKIVYWRPPNPPELPDYIIKEFQDTKEAGTFPLIPDPSLKIHLAEDGRTDGTLKFLKMPTGKAHDFIQFLRKTKVHQSWGLRKTDEVNATGGGAYKYADEVKAKLDITLKQRDEMRCLIRGLNFLLLNVENAAFTYDTKLDRQVFTSGAESLEKDAKFPFPYLLVNVGSGVSILKVESEDSFERISGSSLGGGTFWGLCKLLTDLKSFDEVKEMTLHGDNKNVDLLVGDIYGSDYSSMGLNAEVIASSIGKVATTRTDIKPDYKREDIVKSLLFMMSNNIAQIAYLNAKLYNVERIFFSGGFMQQNEYVWGRFSYAVAFWSQGKMQANFLRHNSYLGALGALLTDLSKS